MTDQEAQAYLASLNQGIQADTSQSLSTPLDHLPIYEDNERDIINKNKQIIAAADNMILDRINSKDLSLKLSEVVSAKTEAFRQIRVLEGKGEELDTRKLIPAVINIQINNIT